MIFTDKPNFDAAEYKARELRLMQDDSSLALDVLKMKFDKQIVIDTYQHYSEVTGIPLEKMSADRCLNDGYMVPRKTPFLVLYNKKCTIKEHLNWTLAHEIGHIYLRHLCDGPKEEIEAHWFAAELLSPEPLINYMVRLNKINFSSDSIRKVFNLSHEASVKRYKSLKNKSDCSPYWQDELESKYYRTVQSYGHNSNSTLKEFVTVRQLLLRVLKYVELLSVLNGYFDKGRVIMAKHSCYGKFDMIKVIITFMCSILMLMFTACEKSADNASNGNIDSPVAQEVISAFAERGVKLGMTEDEVKAVETLTFSIDTSPYATFVQEDITMKTIYSESTVKYNDYDAVVIYEFLNNSLYSMEYRITLNYTDSEVLSSPAYAVFLDFTLKYTDMFGNPQFSETNNDTSLYTSYNNVWFDSEKEEDANYEIYLHTAQSSYRRYTDNYDDDISITFTGYVE